MTRYQMSQGWSIAIPEGWTVEEDSQSGAFIFSREDSDLTMHISPFQAEKEGRPAPAEVMEDAYLQTIPKGAEKLDIPACGLENFGVRGYANTLDDEGRRALQWRVGYYAPGELLSVGIYGSTAEDCAKALELLRSLEKA